MTKTELKQDLALIGAGYWGKNLARNFNELGVLHTICDQNSALLENYKTPDYEGVQLSNSLDTVLENPAITKAAIAVPAAHHFNVAMNLIKAGKDVFIEKPLCLDVNHGEQLLEESEKKKSDSDGWSPSSIPCPYYQAAGADCTR
jgi:UDP-2-acetamido-3-amino-2,3-dideoxy-glucuronate N-acetyltransferase